MALASSAAGALSSPFFSGSVPFFTVGFSNPFSCCPCLPLTHATSEPELLVCLGLGIQITQGQLAPSGGLTRGPFLCEMYVSSRTSALNSVCIMEDPGDGCRNKSVPFSAFHLLLGGSAGTGHTRGARTLFATVCSADGGPWQEGWRSFFGQLLSLFCPHLPSLLPLLPNWASHSL